MTIYLTDSEFVGFWESFTCPTYFSRIKWYRNWTFEYITFCFQIRHKRLFRGKHRTFGENFASSESWDPSTAFVALFFVFDGIAQIHFNHRRQRGFKYGIKINHRFVRGKYATNQDKNPNLQNSEIISSSVHRNLLEFVRYLFPLHCWRW